MYSVYQQGRPLLATMPSADSLKHSCVLAQSAAHASLPAHTRKFSTFELRGAAPS